MRVIEDAANMVSRGGMARLASTNSHSPTPQEFSTYLEESKLLNSTLSTEAFWKMLHNRIQERLEKDLELQHHQLTILFVI